MKMFSFSLKYSWKQTKSDWMFPLLGQLVLTKSFLNLLRASILKERIDVEIVFLLLSLKTDVYFGKPRWWYHGFESF